MGIGRVTWALLLSSFAWSATAPAEEMKLLFTTINPPTSDIVKQVYEPWAERVNAAGKGVVNIDVRHGMTLVNSNNFYERVLADVVQISFGSPSYISGTFPLTEVLSLPFVADSAETGSVAYWRMYKAGAFDTEYAEVVPQYLLSFPQVLLHMTKPLNSPDSLRGFRIITNNKITAQIVDKMGGAPLSLAIFETYDALQRKTADGVTFPWSAFQAFKLGEVTSHHVLTQLGGGPGWIIMAKKKFQALPQEVRKILDAESGEPQSRRYGAFFDALANRIHQTISESKDHTIIKLTQAQEDLWKTRLATIREDWVRQTPGGQRVLDTFRAELAKVKSGS
jgi:TRAP-type C4-dicarboxylate transport system substrate-binding protein